MSIVTVTWKQICTKGSPHTRWIWDWVNHRVGLDEEKEISQASGKHASCRSPCRRRQHCALMRINFRTHLPSIYNFNRERRQTPKAKFVHHA
jgi:hypothetical protein